MEETRQIDIKKKRFGRNNILAIAQFFKDQSSLSAKDDPNYDVNFTLRCQDGTSYSSEILDHLKEGAEIDLKPPKSVEFQYRDYKPKRFLEFTASHGGGYRNSVIIRGAEREWVHSTFLRMTELLNSVNPSKSWLTDHKHFTYHLLALGGGTLIDIVLDLVFQFGRHIGVISPPPTGPKNDAIRIVLSTPIISFGLTWGVR